MFELRAVPGIRCTKPEGAFYAYPNVSAFFGRGGLKSAADVAGRLLREAHVVTVPGEGFGTRDHIRAWKVGFGIYNSVTEYSAVVVTVTPFLGYVRSVHRAPMRAAAAPEPEPART